MSVFAFQSHRTSKDFCQPDGGNTDSEASIRVHLDWLCARGCAEQGNRRNDAGERLAASRGGDGGDLQIVNPMIIMRTARARAKTKAGREAWSVDCDVGDRAKNGQVRVNGRVIKRQTEASIGFHADFHRHVSGGAIRGGCGSDRV